MLSRIVWLIEQGPELWPLIGRGGAADQRRRQSRAIVRPGQNHNALSGFRKEQHVGLVSDILAALHYNAACAISRDCGAKSVRASVLLRHHGLGGRSGEQRAAFAPVSALKLKR